MQILSENIQFYSILEYLIYNFNNQNSVLQNSNLINNNSDNFIKVNELLDGFKTNSKNDFSNFLRHF
jgi:hypothetical protein